MAARILQAATRARLRTGPLNQRIVHYYKKARKRDGPSGRAWMAVAGVSATLFGVGFYTLGKPEELLEGLDTERDKYADENVLKAYVFRARDRVTDFKKMFSEPSSKQLLPDMLTPPHQRPYTLILELNDVLVHSEYDRTVGWKFQKRPGLDKFLMQLFDFYEIIVFTTGSGISAMPVIEALDPERIVMYHLFRDSTKYTDGHHVKDLTHLNRPLSKVIMIDVDPKAVAFQRENSVILDRWTGDVTDNTLSDLVPFLLTVAVNEVADVRPVLDFYKSGGEHNILETFRANQERLKKEEEREREERERKMSRWGAPGYRVDMFKFGLPWKKHSVVGAETNVPMSSTSSVPEEDEPSQSGDEGSSWWSLKGWIGWK